jgi:hypothetical protein
MELPYLYLYLFLLRAQSPPEPLSAHEILKRLAAHCLIAMYSTYLRSIFYVLTCRSSIARLKYLAQDELRGM